MKDQSLSEEKSKKIQHCERLKMHTCTLWDFAKDICFQEAICQYTSQILKFTIYFKLFTQEKKLAK